MAELDSEVSIIFPSEGTEISPGEAAAIAEYRALVAEYEQEEQLIREARALEAEAYEAVLGLEALCQDAVWAAGIRYVQFTRHDGSVGELLTYGFGDAMRAMQVRDNEPRTSGSRHPSRRSVTAFGDEPVYPDVVAAEVLTDTPDDDRSPDELLRRAQDNAELVQRYHTAIRLAQALTVAGAS